MAVKLPIVYDETAKTHRPLLPGAEALSGEAIQISDDGNNAITTGTDGGLWIDALGGGSNPANLISSDVGNILTLGSDSLLLTLAPQINYPALISSDPFNLIRSGSDWRLYARTPQAGDFVSAEPGNQLSLSALDQRLFMGVPSADLFISTNANNSITTGTDGLLFSPTVTATDLVSPLSGNSLQVTNDGQLFVNVMESIQIDANDQILTRSVVGIRGNVSLNYIANTRTVQLLGKDSVLISSFVLPEAAVLQSAEVVKDPAGQPAGTYLRFTFNLSSGATETVYVDLANLMTVYTAGDASIDVTNFTIRVQIDPNSPFGLSANGLTLTYNKLISSDANNMISVGADGKLKAIHPANSSFISANANNALVLGSDGKFFVPVAVLPGGATTTPLIASGTGAVGTGTTWARADHVHPAQSVPAASSTVPLVAGIGAVGTGLTFARNDHVHPAQTTITGNAATATKLATARNFQTNLALSTAVAFDGTANNVHGVTGVLPITHGGTAGNTAAAARTNLGAVNIAGDTMTGGLLVRDAGSTTRSGMWSGSIETPTLSVYNALGSALHEPIIYLRGRRADGTLCNNATYIRALNSYSNVAAGSAMNAAMVIYSGGALYCGSGSSSTNVRNSAAGTVAIPAGWGSAITAKIYDESTYSFFTSNSHMFFVSAAATIANSKMMYLNTSGHLLPGLHNTQDIGAATNRWRAGYFSSLNLNNNITVKNDAGTSQSVVASTYVDTPWVTVKNTLATGAHNSTIRFQSTRADGTLQSTNTYIQAACDYDTTAKGTANDSALLIRAGGALYAGSGESPSAVREAVSGLTAIPAGWAYWGTAKKVDYNEETFWTSDNSMYFISATQTFANSKMALLNNQGHFLPGTTNTQQLGSTAWRWGNVFAKTLTADTITVPSTGLGFTQSFANNGYTKLPNGLILQWGRVIILKGQGLQTFTFPLAFPTACVGGFVHINYNTHFAYGPGVTVSKTSMSLHIHELPAVFDHPYFCFAVGY